MGTELGGPSKSNNETKQFLKSEVKSGKKEMKAALQEVLSSELKCREEACSSLLNVAAEAVAFGEDGVSQLISKVKEELVRVLLSQHFSAFFFSPQIIFFELIH